MAPFRRRRFKANIVGNKHTNLTIKGCVLSGCNENGVQAKAIIESFVAEGYSDEHIHLFAHSNKRAEDIADFMTSFSRSFPPL